jgi:hypothetical protein
MYLSLSQIACLEAGQKVGLVNNKDFIVNEYTLVESEGSVFSFVSPEKQIDLYTDDYHRGKLKDYFVVNGSLWWVTLPTNHVFCNVAINSNYKLATIKTLEINREIKIERTSSFSVPVEIYEALKKTMAEIYIRENGSEAMEKLLEL